MLRPKRPHTPSMPSLPHPARRGAGVRPRAGLAVRKPARRRHAGQRRTAPAIATASGDRRPRRSAAPDQRATARQQRGAIQRRRQCRRCRHHGHDRHGGQRRQSRRRGQGDADAKSGDRPPDGDDAKPASDGKPTDGLTTGRSAAAASDQHRRLPSPRSRPRPARRAAALPHAAVSAGGRCQHVRRRCAPCLTRTPCRRSRLTRGEPATFAAAPDGAAHAQPADGTQADPTRRQPPRPHAAIAARRPRSTPLRRRKAKPAELAAAQADADKAADDANSPGQGSFRSRMPTASRSRPADADKHAARARPRRSRGRSHITPRTRKRRPRSPPTPAPPRRKRQPTPAAGRSTAPSHNACAGGRKPGRRRAPAPQAAAIPLAGVAIEIASKALAGKNHFEIRLDPPELGRIEVRLDVDRDGNVTSRLIADRSDTLDLLRRDAAGLERALAGCRPEDLRQRPAILAARPDRPAASSKPTAAPTPRGSWWKTKRWPRSTRRHATTAASPDSGGGIDIQCLRNRP